MCMLSGINNYFSYHNLSCHHFVRSLTLEKQVKILDETHKVNYKSATETSLQNAKRESRRVIGRIVHQLENGLNNI